MNFDPKFKILCQPWRNVDSRGIFHGDNPLEFPLARLMAQSVVIFFATRLSYFFLKPLRQGVISAQILAGIIIGPSVIGKNSLVAKMFPLTGNITLKTVGNLGLLIHLFIIGIQVDPSMLKRAGRQAILIGSMNFGFPYFLGALVLYFVRHSMTLSPQLQVSLPLMVAINSMSSFVVITDLLADLKILNSELGRLATNISMISDVCSLALSQLAIFVGHPQEAQVTTTFLSGGCIVLFFLVVAFVLRPFILWLTRSSRQREFLNEAQFFTILIIMFSCAFVSEVLGQHAAFGPLILGLALPDGPPLGAALVHKLDPFASGLLLPLLVAMIGLRTDLFFFRSGSSPLIILLIAVVGYVGKFIGTLVPCLFCNIPFQTAFCLSLVMSCKGIIEVCIYIMWKEKHVMHNEAFNICIIMMLIVNGIFRPLVAHLYDPSSKYTGDPSRRPMFNCMRSSHLRVLACIHNPDNVSTVLNVLEVLNPTRCNPVSLFVLQLMELKGRASAILTATNQLQKLGINSTQAEHILNAFEHFERYHEGSVIAEHFTTIAPFASMHDDICMLALEGTTGIVILPYHKVWAPNGNLIDNNGSLRNVNKNVLRKCPCCVGILIDRGRKGRDNPLLSTSESMFYVVLLYFGGSDDWEALTLCKRIAEHQKVVLKIVRFKEERRDYDDEDNSERHLMNEFHNDPTIREKIQYREEVAKDGVETIRVLRTLNDSSNLVVTGRHHDSSSRLMSGLTEWSENAELGGVGDVLASSDFRFSVLVVQQQPQEENLTSSKSLKQLSGRSSSLHSKSSSSGASKTAQLSFV